MGYIRFEPEPQPGNPLSLAPLGSLMALEETQNAQRKLAAGLIEERAERNRIARECAEATQERDQLRELVARMRPVVEAAIAEDITEELADQPDAKLNKLIADELRDARDERRRAVRTWHDLAAGDVAEGRAPLGDVG